MTEKPSLLLSGSLLIFSGFLILLALRIPEDSKIEVIRYMLILVAAVLGLYGVVQLITWIAETAVEIKAEATRADFRVMYASTLRGLPEGAIDHITRTWGLEMFGIMNENLNVIWRLRGSEGYDPDLGFIQAFIQASEDSWPFLYPTNQAYQLGDWPNAERQATAFTRALFIAGILETSRGKFTAKVKPGYTWERLAEEFGVEHE